ncbi:MAG: 7-cyano-7-deazaguanine synthase QueC [Dehalococcoidia bacterium]|nr:7-cyano-7-deazaguanine synthase QueC [Dehalococcoidia bacterium]HJN87005.1 7-cyano-7-deazaguanine synthase QueC [Dehalococcoidia bacterium]
MKRYAVSLLSGGLDSTTVTAHARRETDDLTALTFLYGQTHSKEVDCARKIAETLGVRHRLLDISFFREVAWYSALTNPDRFPIPEDRPAELMGVSIPITYVPLRNTFFLALAAAYLESGILQALEVEGVDPEQVEAKLFMAPNAIDYSGYPDCRPEYFEKMAEALGYGSKLWTQYGVPIKVETPIIQMSKAEIVRMGLELKAPLEHTWSCYQGGQMPCGACDSCVLRAKGFREAGLPDPLLTRLGAV